ncbi:MAG: Nif3-like dinuclear metal center hexameric protein [Chitinophagaceae bacterium]
MNHILRDSPFVKQTFDRRKFITTTLKAACGTALLYLPVSCLADERADLTIQDVINIILKDIPGAPFSKTVDTIKSGSADNKVTGIVTTMFATVDVIKEAIRLKANFIIAHEPTYYNHTDDTRWVEKNEVVVQKQELLEKNGITVWRFHDYWHACKPDGILYGVVKKAGWTEYFKEGETILSMPANTLKNIALHLKDKLGIQHVRVIGDLSKSCKRIALLPGAWGGQNQIRTAENEKPDLLIVGEVHEWETAEYIRDARLLGHDISLIILGHSVSEEPGMEWLVNWLQPKVSGINVTHIASNDPFTWI